MAKKGLKFGSRITYKGEKYLVESVTPRTIRARRIFDISKKYNPHGTVSNVITVIQKKNYRRK